MIDLNLSSRVKKFIPGVLALPTKRGDLGLDLSKSISNRVNFFLTRLSAYNYSVGVLGYYSTTFFIVLFVSSIPALFIQDFLVGVIPIIPTIILIPINIIIVVSFILMGILSIIAFLMILLYLGAGSLFLIKRARLNLTKERFDNSVFQSVQYDNDGEIKNIITLHNDTFFSISRSGLYLISAILIYAYTNFIHSFLLLLFEKINPLIPLSRLILNDVINPQDVVESIDPIVPIGLQSLLNSFNITYFGALISIFLIFAAFLNIKKILQLVASSTLDDTETEPIVFWHEIKKYWLILNIAFYDLKSGKFQSQYAKFRSETIFAIIISIFVMIEAYLSIYLAIQLI